MKLLRKILGHNVILKPLRATRASRREQITQIISHANRTTPFYKGKYDYFLSTTRNLSDEEFFYAFSNLPIATKQDLREQNEDFMSDHLKDKVDLLAGGKVPNLSKFLKHALIKRDFYTALSTGGSSGIPTFRWVDYQDSNIFAQSFLHSFKLNGWNTGENFVVYYPLKSYFTGVYADNEKSLRSLFGFTMVPFEEVTKDSVIELLETLRTRKATLLVIFPCVLQRVAEIMVEEHIPPFENLPYINVSGEYFLDCSKRFINQMFPDSDIQATYGAVEFGEIAHQSTLAAQDYDVFSDYVYLEQGPNNSMLVTALKQKAFPLIRYQIEDMGHVENHANGHQTIKQLEGKNTDYLVGADGYLYYASFFNSLINEINLAFDFPIIHFKLRHQTDENIKVMELNFVLIDNSKEDLIKQAALETVGKFFSNYQEIKVNFCEHFEHDYTRKFKIIGEGDGLAEVVGGYYQRQAS